MFSNLSLGLSDETMLTLMSDDKLATRLESKIPHSTFSKFIQIRPEILTNITKEDSRLYPFIKDLLNNKKFITSLPKNFTGNSTAVVNICIHLLRSEKRFASRSAKDDEQRSSFSNFQFLLKLSFLCLIL